MRLYQAGTGPVRALQFTPDGESLLCFEGKGPESWSGHRAIHRIDQKTGGPVHTLDLCEDAWRRSVSYAEDVETGRAFVSPDGVWVAVERYLGDPVLLDLRDGRTGKWREVPFGSEYHFCVDSATFSPDSALLVFASGTDGGGTQLLERKRLRSGRMLPPIDFPGVTARQLLFSPDERRLAALTFGGVVLYEHSRREVDAGGAVELELEDEAGPIRFRPDGEELAVAFGHEVLFWDCRSRSAPLAVKPAPGRLVADLCCAPDGRSVVLACEDGTARVWDRAAGKEVRAYDWQIGAPVFSVAFAPDGMTCAAGGPDGRVVVWDVGD